MVSYKCDTCKKEFKQKCDYDRHINRKNKCIPVVNPKQQKMNIPESNRPPLKQYQCQNCKKIFTTNSNLCKHVTKKVCYTEKDLSMIEKLRDELKGFEDTISIMKRKIEELEKKNIAITTNNKSKINPSSIIT